MNIGHYTDGSPVELSLAGIVGMNGLVIAAPGGGKSGLLRKVLEQTYGRLPHVVFDPDDEFFTLRERHEYLVVGGDTGDAPAEVRNAAALARLVVDHQVSMVIQMNHLKDDDPQLFADEFLREMMETPRAKWRPMIIAIDEAQRFVPEGAVNDSSAAVRDVMSRGRKRGISVWLASQRISFVAKDVTEICQNVFLGISGLGNDLDRSCKMLGVTRASASGRSLTEMPPRTFWTYGPATARVPRQFYVSDTDTTIPQIGQPAPPTPPAPEAMRGLLEALRMAAKVGSPDTPATPGAPVEPLSSAAREAIRDEAHRAGYMEGHVSGVKQGFSGALGELRPVVKRLEELAYGDVHDAPAERPPAITTAIAGTDINERFIPVKMVDGEVVPADGAPTPPLYIPTADETPPLVAGLNPTPSQQRILDGLAWMAKMRPGEPAVSKTMLGFLAGMSPSGGTFIKYLGAMRSAGLISYPAANMVVLTPTGRTLANAPKRIANKTVQDAVMDRLSAGGQRRMLEIALEEHPREITKEQLAERADMTASGGTFIKYLGRLRALELVTYPSHGRVRASDLLFPENYHG